MVTDREKKLTSIRWILLRLPKWKGDFTHVRLDRDGEVVLGHGVDSTQGSESLGYVTRTAIRDRTERQRLFNKFAKHQTCELDSVDDSFYLIGYEFSRMEYEMLKAVVEAEDADKSDIKT